MSEESLQTTNYQSGMALVKRLFRQHIWHYRGRLMLAVLCMVAAAAATAANAWLLQPALDQIFIEKNRQMLMIIPAAVLCVSLVNAAANYGQTLLMRYIGQRIVADMQVQLFSHLMKSDLGLFHDQASGRLISRFTNDIQMMRAATSNALTTIAKELLTMLFLVGVMFYQSVELTMVAFFAFPIAIYPVVRLGKRMRKISDRTQDQLGEFTARLDETFQNARSVKAYAREEHEVGKAKQFIESLFALYFKAARVQAGASPLMEAFSGVAIGAVIWYGGWKVLEGATTPGAFFSFIAAFIMAYRPVKAMAGLNTNLQEGLAAAARLFKALDAKPTVVDKPGAAPLKVQQGHILFDQVSFAYAPGGGGIFDMTLDVPAGKKVALVGLSGGGKSTILSLLLRFYDVQKGTISIDGVNVADVTQTSLREAMAFVPQEVALFDDTVRANIAYGRLDAGEEEIVEAAKAAAADEFIRALPQGYDTLIGPHGVKLSGGQRQRLSIARAMVKNAPLLLLDEATSALDNESERAVQQALTRLMQGRTTLVIAHRLSTIIHSDLIYVIDQGKVAESGTHDSLLALKGKYYQLYATHFAQ